ncbi:MAG: acyl-CoA dehydrogenase family protein, partial [Planctomycetota bacterium]
MSVKTSHEPNEQLPIDTTGMNRGQRAAMEVAESARDTADSRDGFAGELFMGRLDPHRLLPFPAQDDEDRAIGDEMVRKVSALLSERLDPEA